MTTLLLLNNGFKLPFYMVCIINYKDKGICKYATEAHKTIFNNSTPDVLYQFTSKSLINSKNELKTYIIFLNTLSNYIRGQ